MGGREGGDIACMYCTSRFSYRETIQLVTILPLTSKQKSVLAWLCRKVCHKLNGHPVVADAGSGQADGGQGECGQTECVDDTMREMRRLLQKDDD